MSDVTRHGSTFVWGYGSDNGPSKWGQYYPICLGKRQSPINIDSLRTTFNPKLEHIQASHYISPQPNIKTTLTNIGKSIFIQPAIDYSPVLVDPLNSGVFYRAHHLHFHWGASDNYGSENAIDNKYYPIEIHIVHYNIKYQNVLQAIPKPDGLAVIGIFAKIGEGSAGFSWLLQYMQKLQYKDETVTANGFSYSSFLPKDMSKYFTFPGSLTTPLCEESVRWIVMEEPITISSQQSSFNLILHV
ncbi:uncharacterized protein TRIADDRAFT_51649 [Trichoplax adhaerens]|uniref:Carbonic anhydrase n=1 Tax=Trichoplax adhaerens TaxID=10228 RepID=B3RKE3_TRIAD|nr:predicted protein [Trichoplax adhaerens]EDV29391.1 predicted protein [Trichoplax adhaerens]|eukprot:XP_002108593.1 predicted protein [Trichoplax adhaerens]